LSTGNIIRLQTHFLKLIKLK